MNDINTNMVYVRIFIHNHTGIPDVDEAVWKLFGICLGDGFLTSYQNGNRIKYDVLFTGNVKENMPYYKDFLVPMFKSKFGARATPHIKKDCNIAYLRINNKKVFGFFKELDTPVGKKKNIIKITDTVFNSPACTKAAVLRRLLDTDGRIFARKDEKYKYPQINITSTNSAFLFQMKRFIREFSIPVYVHLYRRASGAGDVVVRGSNKIKNWMKLIGMSYPLIKKRYKEWAATGKLFPKSTHVQIMGS